MASVVFLNGSFDFGKHSSCDGADGCAEGIESLASVELEDAEEILLLKVVIRSVRQSGIHGVCDTVGNCPSESYLCVVFIILLKEAIRNDVEDRLLVLLPILRSKVHGNHFKLYLKTLLGFYAEGCFQSILDRFSVLLLNVPKLIQCQRASAGSGVRHIEHIAQIGLFSVRYEQGDTFGATLYIAVLFFSPRIEVLTERCVRALGVDHDLLRISEAIISPNGS